MKASPYAGTDHILANHWLRHLDHKTSRNAERGTDGKVLCPAYKLPAVIFGPGSFSQAHAPNEYVTWLR